MKKEQAEQEKDMFRSLKNKILVHKTYKKKMKVTDLVVEQTGSTTRKYYVCCKLKGDLGEITETLDYVLKNYNSA